MFALDHRPPPVRIRAAGRDDIPALARARTASWRHAYRGIIPAAELRRITAGRSAIRLQQALESRDRGHRLLVVEHDGGAVGYAWLGPVHSAPRSSAYQGEIYELYLDPNHQRVGLGRRLLGEAIWTLVALRLNPVIVWVLADNRARYFYETCGGIQTATGTVDVGHYRTRRIAYGWPDMLPLPLSAQARET